MSHIKAGEGRGGGKKCQNEDIYRNHEKIVRNFGKGFLLRGSLKVWSVTNGWMENERMNEQFSVGVLCLGFFCDILCCFLF